MLSMLNHIMVTYPPCQDHNSVTVSLINKVTRAPWFFLLNIFSISSIVPIAAELSSIY